MEESSYPIEIGWAPGAFESLLIRPTKEWAKDGVWSDLSEEIHGIIKPELQSAGVSPSEAITRLEVWLSGSIVPSDVIGWEAIGSVGYSRLLAAPALSNCSTSTG